MRSSFTHHNETRANHERGAALADVGRVTKRRPVLLAFVVFSFIFAASIDAAEGVGENASAASGGARPAILLAAGGEPSREEIGASAQTGIYLLGGLLIALQVIQFFRPQPALHKQFADREDTDKKIDHMLAEVEKLGSKFQGYMSEQAVRRRMMYSRLSRCENAIACQIGMMAREGNQHDAERLQKILDTRVEAAHDD